MLPTILKFMLMALAHSLLNIFTKNGIKTKTDVPGRPVSDSPIVFSLARRQISLAFLAERDEREKMRVTCFIQGRPPLPLKRPADSLLFGVLYIGPTLRSYIRTYIIAHANSTRSCNKACLFIVMFIAIFNKIPLLCAITLWYCC